MLTWIINNTECITFCPSLITYSRRAETGRKLLYYKQRPMRNLCQRLQFIHLFIYFCVTRSEHRVGVKLIINKRVSLCDWDISQPLAATQISVAVFYSPSFSGLFLLIIPTTLFASFSRKLFLAVKCMQIMVTQCAKRRSTLVIHSPITYCFNSP